MALTYTQTIQLKAGGSMTLSAGDSDVLVLNVPAPDLKLTLSDAAAVQQLFQALVQAKAADIRLTNANK